MATQKPVTIKDGVVTIRAPYTEVTSKADGTQVVRFELDGHKQSVKWGTPAQAE